jgi:hypothetical protein
MAGKDVVRQIRKATRGTFSFESHHHGGMPASS